MLEPESLEEYLKWRVDNSIRANELDWDTTHARHSELLGYFRWCKMKRKEDKSNATYSSAVSSEE